MRNDYVTQLGINTVTNVQLNALRTQDMIDRTTSMFGEQTTKLFDSMMGLWYPKSTDNDKPTTPRKT